jgi:hypothetical protein
MPLLASVAALAAPWASFYNDAPAVQSTTTFVHFAGLLLGGGFAIATDWATLQAARADVVERGRQLAHIHRVHRPVLVGLALTFASGLLMFAADVETLAASPVFWTKMGLVALMLANGAVMARTESALRGGAPDVEPRWRRLRGASVASFALWFAALLAGTLLVNAA